MYIYKNGVVETIIFMQPSAVKNRLKRNHMKRIRFVPARFRAADIDGDVNGVSTVDKSFLTACIICRRFIVRRRISNVFFLTGESIYDSGFMRARL